MDILTTLYAIYHLTRPAKGRTPTSSASYHFFALVMDAGFIPFYVFAAMMARSNYDQEPDTLGRWRSFFNNGDATAKLFFSTWLVAIVCGGLHLISSFLDLYLVLIFRKISNLPPDMNPLEDNLTSRHSRKHKHKDSAISISEKHLSASTASLGDSSRMSRDQVYPPIPQATSVPFLRTRTNADQVYSPHTPQSARASRVSQAAYSAVFGDGPHSARNSYVGMQHREGSQDPSQRASLLGTHLPSPPQHSQRHSMVVGDPRRAKIAPSGTSFVTSVSYDGIHPHDLAEREPRSVSPVTQSDNWQVHSDSESDSENAPQPIGRRSKVGPFSHTQHPRAYYAVSSSAADDEVGPRHHDSDDLHAQSVSSSATSSLLHPPMHPLSMHPPTPPPPSMARSDKAKQQQHQHQSTPEPTASRQPPTRVPTTSSSVYSFLTNRSNELPTHNNNVTYDNDASDRHRSATPPKRRFYGSLRAATAAIVVPKAGPVANKGFIDRGEERWEQGDAGREREREARVVSRSGVDVDGRGWMGEVDGSEERWGGRRREVSGKIVEEGRARRGTVVRRTSGAVGVY